MTEINSIKTKNIYYFVFKKNCENFIYFFLLKFIYFLKTIPPFNNWSHYSAYCMSPPTNLINSPQHTPYSSFHPQAHS